MKNNNKIDVFKYLLATAVFLILLLADQISKYLIVSRLDEGQEINIISNRQANDHWFFISTKKVLKGLSSSSFTI